MTSATATAAAPHTHRALALAARPAVGAGAALTDMQALHPPHSRGLPPTARRGAGLVVTAGLHLLLACALLQTRAVHDAVFETAPIFVRLVSPPEVARPAELAPPPRPPAALAVPALTPLPLPLWTVTEVQPGPMPATAASRAAPAEPGPSSLLSLAPAGAGSAPVAAPAPPSPPSPPSPPHMIPAAAVQFTLPPVIEYPRLARRNAEAGLVIVRAYVDADGGAPRSVQVERSSGFVRLDQAALAAVQKARFKPHSENGRPVEGWALVPIRFELES